MSGCWSAVGAPIAQGDDVLTVLPGTLPEDELARRFADTDAAVVMKLGRHLPKVRRALSRAGRLRARSMSSAARPSRRLQCRSPTSPTISRRISPSCWCPAGKGGHERLTLRDRPRAGRPERIQRRRLPLRSTQADALYGYGPYLDRVPWRPGQTRHPSDNREEVSRAQAALRHAATGASVALVSGGDPGVFAMAAAVCEAIEGGRRSVAQPRPHDRARRHRHAGGRRAGRARRSAMISARFRCPTISSPGSSSNAGSTLRRAAGFVIALYNPVSRARPWQLGVAFERLRQHLPAATPVVFGRAVGRSDEQVAVTSLGAADPAIADMATLIIVGSAETRDRRAARPDAAGLYAAIGAGRRRMIEPARPHRRTLSTAGTGGSGGRRSMITSTPSARAAAILP